MKYDLSDLKQRIQRFGVHSAGTIVEATDTSKIIWKKMYVEGAGRKENGAEGR